MATIEITERLRDTLIDIINERRHALSETRKDVIDFDEVVLVGERIDELDELLACCH